MDEEGHPELVLLDDVQAVLRGVGRSLELLVAVVDGVVVGVL